VDNVSALQLRDFSIQRGSKRLTVRSLSSVQAAEHRLVLTETGEERDASSLRTLGLTKREAEVLFWVSQGKRNCEIAEILGARSRTIGKHVERIWVNSALRHGPLQQVWRQKFYICTSPPTPYVV